MRYRYEKIKPDSHEKRLHWKFAWFPVTIGGETRLWEWVLIEQEYLRMGFGEYTCYGWENIRFIDSIMEK